MARVIKNQETGEEYDFDEILLRAQNNEPLSLFELDVLRAGMIRFRKRAIQIDSLWDIMMISNVPNGPIRYDQSSITVDGMEFPFIEFSVGIERIGDKPMSVIKITLPALNFNFNRFIMDPQEASAFHIKKLSEEFGVDLLRYGKEASGDTESHQDNPADL